MFPTKTSRDVGMVGCVSEATGSCMERTTGGKSPGTRRYILQCNNPVNIRRPQRQPQWHQRHSPPSLHRYLFLWETFLLPLFLYFLQSTSCMTCEHEPCMYKLALKVQSHKHMSKYDSFHDPCARVSHASRQISYGLNTNVFIHQKCIQEMGGH